MPSFDPESQFSGHVMGVDEVGYGAWAGPVLAGAVFIDRGLVADSLDFVRDSKRLSEAQRVRANRLLRHTSGVYWALGHASAREIDDVGIAPATRWAMERAIYKLHHKFGGMISWAAVLFDGVHHASRVDLPWPCHNIVRGDDKSYSIAAASILAKVCRDQLMARLARRYPHYGWHSNVGYGTRTHQSGLDAHGPSPLHRLSYAPLQKFQLIA